MREYFQLTYKVLEEEEKLESPLEGGRGNEWEESGRVVLSRLLVTLSCVGVGYSNFSRGTM